MTGLHVGDLRKHVIRPALRALSLPAPRTAEELLLGTAAVESELGAAGLRQHPTGPARGIWQMEPATYRWCLERMAKGPNVARRERLEAACGGGEFPFERMIWDLRWAAGLARWRYWLVPAALPSRTNHWAMARYWDRYYNANGEDEAARWVRRYRALLAREGRER